jgi:hypothetical protein
VSKTLLAILLLLSAARTPASAGDGTCTHALTDLIPARSPAAPGGSEFVSRLATLNDDQRESAILGQLLAGNIPAFLRQLAPVSLGERGSDGPPARVVVCVLPDYLAIGSDTDFFLAPMRLRTALTVADRFRFWLPTRRIVDAVYAQAAVHLQPQPLPASDTMRSTAYYWHHNELVLSQRLDVPLPLGTLTAGDKKDLVLTNRLWDHLSSVAIYGWHQGNGRPIQPLSTFHGARYADYSHGVRLVSATVYVDGVPRPMPSLLQDSRVAEILSDEGRMRNITGLLELLQASSLAANTHTRAQ